MHKTFFITSALLIPIFGAVIMASVSTSKAPPLCINKTFTNEEYRQCVEQIFFERAVATEQLSLCTRTGTMQTTCAQNILQSKGQTSKSILPCDRFKNTAQKEHCMKNIVHTLNNTESTTQYCTLLPENIRTNTETCREKEQGFLSTPEVEKTTEKKAERPSLSYVPLQKTGNITLCSQIVDIEEQITCATEILKKFPEEKNRSVSKEMKKTFCEHNNTALSEEQLNALENLCRLL